MTEFDDGFNEDDFIPAKEIAAQLGLCLQSVMLIAKKQDIAKRKKGRMALIHIQQFNKYLQEDRRPRGRPKKEFDNLVEKEKTVNEILASASEGNGEAELKAQEYKFEAIPDAVEVEVEDDGATVFTASN